ncbi:MAG: hypothetical protein ACOYOV_17470 [Bacteroidales bacterium]
MKRKAIIIRTSKDGKRQIAVDQENYSEIINYIAQDSRHKSKFNDICKIILDGLRNTDLYDKENINNKCKQVTAMKFFKGQENDRLYCKEIRQKNKVFVVVSAELHKRKKSQKNTQKEINLIEKVAGYEYEIIQSTGN